MKAKKISKTWHYESPNQTQRTRKHPRYWEKRKDARDADFHGSPKSQAPAPPSSSQVKRKPCNTPKGNPTKVAKRGKNDSPATILKVDKAEVTDLKRALRDMEDDLQTARDRVTRLEDREDEVKNSYKEMKEKSEEKLEDYDNLQSLKRATYNHFLAKWEHENEKNQGEDITALKNAFPLTLRRYFSEEIEKDKSSLK